MVTDWLTACSPSSDKFSASITATSWSFDGNFQRNENTLQIHDLFSLSHAITICELDPFPIEFSNDKLETLKNLRERGEMFWKCRARNYVSYKSFVDDGIETAVSSRMNGRNDTI